MNFATVAALSLLALVTPSAMQTADACGPVPTCGDWYCSDPDAVISAEIISLAPDSKSVTLRVDAVHGNAPELIVGQSVTLAAHEALLYQEDTGQQRYLYLERTDMQALRVYQRIDPSFYHRGCFEPNTDVATVAAVVLSPSCGYELDGPNPTRNPPGGCPDDEVTCSAGTPSGCAPMLAAFIAIVVVRRRRART